MNVSSIPAKSIAKKPEIYLASSLLELIESPRIIRSTFIPNSFPKLSKIDEISSNATFIAENPSEESDNRKRTDDFVSEGGEGVRFLYVSSN